MRRYDDELDRRYGASSTKRFHCDFDVPRLRDGDADCASSDRLGSARLQVAARERPGPTSSLGGGTLCYQRKRRSEDWEDVDAIQLSSLHAGEGVKLDIRSGEILKLFRGLQVLYDTVEHDGVPTGVHQYIQADAGTVLADVAGLLNDGRASDLLQTFLS